MAKGKTIKGTTEILSEQLEFQFDKSSNDQRWMKRALSLAERAAEAGEVPVGAILVGPDGQAVAKAYNLKESLPSPIGHAEILSLHRAAKRRNQWRLDDCTLYVTLEPCLMCAGAILQARVGRVVYGARDPKGGAVDSLFKTLSDSRLNHTCETIAGVLEEECAAVLTKFFKNRRAEAKDAKPKVRVRTSVVVVHENKILGFHAQDPTNKKKYFFLPGGKIEDGESSIEAAVRETMEETGYKIKILPKTKYTKVYDFEWDGEVNRCHTDFYFAILDQKFSEPKKVQDAEYHLGVEWLDLKKVDSTFSYHRDVLLAVQRLVRKAKQHLSK